MFAQVVDQKKYAGFPDESAVDVSTSCAFYQTSIML